MIEIRSRDRLDPQLLQDLTVQWPKVQTGPGAGFIRMIEDDALWESIEKRLEECGGVDKVLHIGIGGSSLGTQVIYDTFRAASAAQFFFLEAVDRYRWDYLRDLGGDWRDRHIVIVSKSGGTLETLAWVEKLAKVDRSWIRPDRCTVIASPGEGPLQTWARRHDLPCLWIPAEVGGRFSVLSPVGMFPAGLMGLGRLEFREGARWALARPNMACELAAVALQAWGRNEWITENWIYSEALRTFGEWWQQLWSESLAKKTDRSGQKAPRVSTPISCQGPRDQHSVLQQLMEGQRDKQVILTRVLSAEAAGESFVAQEFPEMPFNGKSISLGGILGAQAQAFEQALTDSSISYCAMELKNLNEQTMGAVFMLWQMAIAILGEHLGIDAFNQPGVELGKRHADKILRQL